MGQSLIQISHEVNIRLQKSKEYWRAAREKSQEDSRRARDHRIAAGVLLIAARKRVEDGEAGNIGWYAWLEENIERSIRDCKRVMKIAGYVDPEEALEREREAARNRMILNRGANKKCSSPAMEELVIEFNALSQREKDEFLRQIGAIRQLSPPPTPSPPCPPSLPPAPPTLPPISPRSDSPSGESGANAPIDPIKELFDRGVRLLTDCGAKEPQARSIIGKWRKTYSDPLMMAAIVHCEDESISDPVPQITRFLENHRGANGHGKPRSSEDRMRAGLQAIVDADREEDLLSRGGFDSGYDT